MSRDWRITCNIDTSIPRSRPHLDGGSVDERMGGSVLAPPLSALATQHGALCVMTEQKQGGVATAVIVAALAGTAMWREKRP